MDRFALFCWILALLIDLYCHTHHVFVLKGAAFHIRLVYAAWLIVTVLLEAVCAVHEYT
jgi:hypothetical protein